MCKCVIVIVGLLLGAVSPAWAQGVFIDDSLPEIPKGEMTLVAAQRLALENSPGIAEAVSRIEAAQAVVARSESSLWPQLTLTAGYRLQDSTMQPDWAPEIRKDENFTNLSAGLQANWLIFNGFARKAGILAAKYGVEASETGLDEVRRLLCDVVSSAFFQAQLAMESMTIAKSNREFNRLLESDADKRWQVGTIAEAEKLNFSVRALQAESDYLDAARNFAVVSTVLAELMALPEARLPEQLYPVSALDQEQFSAIPDVDEELAYALQHRPDLLSLKAQLAAAEQQKVVARGDYFPKISLNGGFSYSEMDGVGTIDQEEHDTYLGLNLSWDLFSGGARSARVRESSALASGIRSQLESRVLSIQSEMTQAVERARNNLALYRRHEKALEMTLRIRDHIEKAYRAGVTTLTRLNEVQRDLVQMAGLAVYSRINYQIALEDIKVASGRVVDSVGIK